MYNPRRFTNLKVRHALLDLGLTQYDASELFGLHSTSFNRKLRKELPEAEQDEIIEQIKVHLQERTEQHA